MNMITNNLIKKVSGILLISTITFSAWAISLGAAKQQGLVGEMSNGYLGVVVNSPEAKNLVNSVNQKRKQIYIDLARKNKITMEQVTALAGKKALAKTRSGHFIKNTSGQWIKK
ncbi:YdbL family protein [Colwellia sp. 20A7]|uniref:YdbL family protein n=1 Tax=Colwellia sp. 20A7 TaxID=2689569 RepID=UPI0013588FFA|nr:YdbL family protein [Colwellia sp. 20A7]